MQFGFGRPARTPREAAWISLSLGAGFVVVGVVELFKGTGGAGVALVAVGAFSVLLGAILWTKLEGLTHARLRRRTATSCSAVSFL
jgi:hypothetical protein